jgi:hypothetical protein
VGINKEKNDILIRNKGVEPKTRKRKLRSGVNWQGMLKQKRVKQVGIKQDLGMFFSVGRENQMKKQMKET